MNKLEFYSLEVQWISLSVVISAYKEVISDVSILLLLQSSHRSIECLLGYYLVCCPAMPWAGARGCSLTKYRLFKMIFFFFLLCIVGFFFMHFFFTMHLYAGSSESIASYLIILAHNVRD